MSGVVRRCPAVCGRLRGGRAAYPLFTLVGALALSAFSALQKLQLGVPTTRPLGYAIPVLFGGLSGLGFAVAYRHRERSVDRLRAENEERRETERGLRRYRQAVESSTNLITALDREYTVLFANREYRSFHDLPPEDDAGEHTLPSVLGEEAFAAVKPYVDRAFEGEACEFEIARAGPDGDTRLFTVRNFPLESDDGEITGAVAALNDVTERRAQEQELVAQKQRYQSLFESIPDAIVVADTDHHIANTNPAFRSLFGYDEESIEDASVADLYADDVGFDPAGARGDAATGPQARTFEYVKQSGQVFTGEQRLFALRDTDDAVVGYVVIVRDVSERESRLQQLQVLERVLRHNINNDMNVIGGYAETIRDVGPDSVREYAETIVETSDALVETAAKERQITEYLLRSPDPNRRDLADAVTEVVARARDRYPDADLSVAIPPSCAATATDGIGQAIEELLENAVVHSDRETPSVRVAVQQTDETLAVTVADDGPGIPEMERAVLTGDADIDPLYHGSGLGLWLVNLIVRQSDGVLTFEENDPRGSVVQITLPADTTESVSEQSERGLRTGA